MEYPLISEYKEAILSAGDNFNELSSLRPVLDDYGNPVMSSGNFAVVFKMRDEHDGKLYAVKCFIKHQEGRDESYRKIADELETVSSSYILPLRYLEKELFVDTDHCSEEEFPVVVMEWIEGETLDSYLNRNLQDKYELEMISYRFNRMAAWLLAQPFAHGDLKPDNILVRNDGSLVLIDYDGMFVPSMKGEKAREIGSPDYRHPLRTDADFDEHVDDFSIAVIALSITAIVLKPSLKNSNYSSDSLLFRENDFLNINNSEILKEILSLTADENLSRFLSAFFLAYANKNLDMLSFRLFRTEIPMCPNGREYRLIKSIDTSISNEDIEKGIRDEFGVIYSKDLTRLLKCPTDLSSYYIPPKTEIICDKAFKLCTNLEYIVIPDSVTTIGKEAFHWCESLKEVIIPESVTTIKNEAFSRCRNLKYAEISNSIKIIEEGTFSCCSNLQHLVIPESVEIIENEAFSGCSTLRSVILPDSLVTIEDGAFSGCWNLQRLNIPTNLTNIGSNPFIGCHKLKLVIDTNINFKVIDGLLIDNHGTLISSMNNSVNIIIPDSVRIIGKNAFIGCDTIQSILIPDTVTTIGDSAFSYCYSLHNISIPNSIITIGKKAFCACNIQSLVIPDSVTTIGSEAFSFCHSLNRLVIPESVTTIGNEAFSNCTGLQQLNIPKNIINIGINPFICCKNLSLDIDSNQNFTILNGLLIDRNGILISCLRDSSNIIIPTIVKMIGDKAFSQNRNLRSVFIPDSVKKIGHHAFSWCITLQNVMISDSITDIGIGAFLECKSLQRIEIPTHVKIITSETFSGCEALQRIEIPESVNFIGDGAFVDCKSLECIEIPDSVTAVGKYAFYKCNALKTIEIPNFVTILGEGVFKSCDSLKRISLPKSLDNIGKDAFPKHCTIIRRC